MNDRPPRLQLIEALSLVEAHRRVSDINTDLAGRFSAGAAPQGRRGNGMRHQNSISDRHYDIETRRRICRQIGTHIESILRREDPRHWSFAAPAEINEAILDEIKPAFRSRIAENLTSDLVNVEAAELLGRFSVHAIEFAA